MHDWASSCKGPTIHTASYYSSHFCASASKIICCGGIGQGTPFTCAIQNDVRTIVMLLNIKYVTSPDVVVNFNIVGKSDFCVDGRAGDAECIRIRDKINAR